MIIGPHISDKAAWKAAHKGRIGSGDAPVLVLGSHFGRTPMDLYLRETGLVEEDTSHLDDAEGIKMGNLLEPIVASLFFSEMNDYEQVPKNAGHVHISETEQTCATPDFFLLHKDHGKGILETKTAGSVKAWDEHGAPQAYVIQVQHQLWVTGLSYAYLAALGGGHRGLAFRHVRIERDDAFIEGVLAPAIAKFWQMVDSHTPPPADFSESYSRAIAKVWPKDNGETIELPSDLVAADDEIQTLSAEIAERNARVTLLENQIREALKENTAGRLPNGAVWTWKTQARKGYTVKDSTIRVLRRKGS